MDPQPENRFLEEVDARSVRMPKRIHALHLVFLDAVDPEADAEIFIARLLAVAGQLDRHDETLPVAAIQQAAARARASIGCAQLPGLVTWLGEPSVARYVAAPNTQHEERGRIFLLRRGRKLPTRGGLLDLALQACQAFRFPCSFHDLDCQLLHDLLLYGLRESIGWLYSRVPLHEASDVHDWIRDEYQRIAIAAQRAEGVVRSRIMDSATRSDAMATALQRILGHHLLVLSKADRIAQVRNRLSTNGFAQPL